ncbi:hypothetical protein [Mobilicoccus sp.]|uniref:hypothetical protein n=1 Tax=Mobilicoccus sp. TaxID=2034349 RepID=UPI0028ADB2EC|nr:hypothetical protein [Mobilicoccus sp.]
MTTIEPDLEELRTRAARILQAMDATPIPAMDATFHAHYTEELRMVVEELLAADPPCHRVADRVWLLWNCDDIIGTYRSELDAQEARADLQHQLLCDYGLHIELLESITITTADIRCVRPAALQARP